MIRLYQRGTKRSLSFLLSSLLIAAIVFGGCRRKNQADDLMALRREIALNNLEELVRNKDPRVRGRAQTALSQLKDRLRNVRPIIMTAGLTAHDSGEALLCITCFDNDGDLHGLSIAEHYIDLNSETQTILERYSVFLPDTASPCFVAPMFTVEIRTKGERQDEQAWKEYMTLVDGLPRSSTEGGNAASTPTSVGTASEAPPAPPIWVSIPEPNHVHVSVSIYDRAGHESDSIELQVAPWDRRALEKIADRRKEPG